MLITASQIIEKSWQIYFKNFKKFLPYTLLLGIILFLNSFTNLLQPIEYKYGLITENGVVLFIGVVLFVLVFSILTIWVSTMFSLAIRDALDNQPKREIKTIRKLATSLLWPVLYTSVLAALIIIFGTILVIIPGIIFTVWYVFSNYEIIFENKTGFSALKTSKDLVVGRWFKIAWRLFCPIVLFAFGMFIALLITLVPLNSHYISRVDTETITQRINYLILQGEGDISKLSPSEQKEYLLNYHPQILLPMPVLIINNIVSSIVYMFFLPLSYIAFILLYFSAKQNPIENTNLRPIS